MEQVEPQAKQRIESRLVLEAVAKAEGLEATEDDYNKEIEKMAENYKMEKDKVIEMIGDEGKKQIMEDIAVSKAVDFVVDNAKESK
jgi:trigger factor